ncbi:hypothetical protein ACHWQZ_G015713 [Mnemiopsis leidyi]
MDGNIASEYSDFFFSPLEIKDEDGNVLYRIEETQKKYLYQDYLDLTKDPILKDKITVNIPTNKTVYIDITVWDYDGEIWEPEFIRSITNMIVPFHLREEVASLTIWSVKTFRDPSEPGATDGQGILGIKYRILECDEGFTGFRCNYCAEGWKGDSCSECAEGWTGDSCSECAEGWTGDSCSECADNFYPAGQCTKFCVRQRRYTCTSEGEIQCLDNFYPAGQCKKLCVPETNRYTCTSEGEIQCLENYYPARQCTKFCEPETNRYTCTSEGEIQCLENYYPAGKCTKFCVPETNRYTCTSEGEIHCLKNYYPAGQCTKFCEPETNRYTCTSEGEIQCLENYFPAGQCTKFCEPETNRYTCTSEGKISMDFASFASLNNKKRSLVAAWALAGLFFLTTIILSGVVFKKFLQGKCYSTDDISVHEYIENTIIQSPAKSSGAADTTYNNHELYKL